MGPGEDCQDVGHPGYNNNFLINARHDHAVTPGTWKASERPGRIFLSVFVRHGPCCYFVFVTVGVVVCR